MIVAADSDLYPKSGDAEYESKALMNRPLDSEKSHTTVRKTSGDNT